MIVLIVAVGASGRPKSKSMRLPDALTRFQTQRLGQPPRDLDARGDLSGRRQRLGASNACLSRPTTCLAAAPAMGERAQEPDEVAEVRSTFVRGAGEARPRVLDDVVRRIAAPPEREREPPHPGGVQLDLARSERGGHGAVGCHGVSSVAPRGQKVLPRPLRSGRRSVLRLTQRARTTSRGTPTCINESWRPNSPLTSTNPHSTSAQRPAAPASSSSERTRAA
jgi:hypothetical protein